MGILVLWDPFDWLPNGLQYGFGSALIASVVTSGLIGWAFNQRLAEDAFRASIGYLLPDELKPELEWVYGQKILATSSTFDYEFAERNDGKILITLEGNRCLRNIGRKAEKIRIKIGASIGDEILERPILEVGYKVDDENEVRQINLEQRSFERDVNLPRGGELRIWFKTQTIRASRGEDFLYLLYATVNPTVKVKPSENLDVEPSFGHREHSEKLIKLSEGTYQLAATLLPLQIIVVRWKAKGTDW